MKQLVEGYLSGSERVFKWSGAENYNVLMCNMQLAYIA